MKRLATLVLAAGFGMGSLVALGQSVSATPFSDVPANHWAYQAIQSLAADGLVEGYPDGRFKGDRPLTRYEMAVLVARVIAKLQANGAGYASKADLDKLQKLIDALKDELDSLGVRVTNLEDALSALDKRTKFAQSIQLHGSILDNNSARQRYGAPQTIAHGGIDPFVYVFMSSPDNNSPLEQTGTGNLIRFDDRFNFSYAISENLTVSLPIHIINYQYGGEFTPQAKYSIQPDVVVNVAKAGALTNLYLRDGQLDNLKSSRVGLTYRAPDATQQGPGYENPVQPYEKGFEVGGVLNGLTEFQFSWTRIDQSMINTSTGVADPNGEFSVNNYFFIVNRPQTSYFQPGAPNAAGGAAKTDTFNGPLTSVYLTAKAQIGTVYVSSVGGVACNSAALTPTGAPCPIAAGAWYYIDSTNQVVFQTPVPAGTTVQITYVRLTYNNNSQYQRYHVNARVNQKIKGIPGAEIGASFSRIFDLADVINSQGTPFCFSAPNASGLNPCTGASAAGNGFGVVSDTVFGLDAQLPLWFITLGSDRTQHPTIFAEGAYSKYTPDFYNTPAITDSAGVIGLRLKVAAVTASVQYQAVGPNFMDGAPLRYFGNSPATFQFWRGNYFPQFFGFGNNVGINTTFDSALGTTTRNNANLTYIYPVFNPFVASGPQYFSAFAPNTQGWTVNANAPFRIGDVAFNGSVLGQHLDEMVPNGFGQLAYGPGFASGVKLKFDKLQGGLQFALPVFGQKLALNFSAATEHLARNDKTPASYTPFNPQTGGADPASAAALNTYLGAGATPVLFYPNYIDEYHNTIGAGATLPVTRDVSLGAAYSTQTYHGSYGTTLSQNIAQRKDLYTVSATYNIPKTTSSITAFFRNQKYTDNVLPTYNFNQNREDVNFTIRF